MCKWVQAGVRCFEKQLLNLSLLIIMKKLFVTFFCLLCTVVSAATPPRHAPKAIIDQVQRLTELLRDSYAVGYPAATMVQMVKLSKDEELVLTVFTVEGFGGGNNHMQYFAAFQLDTDEDGKHPHFTLIDVIPIAGKGWRGVQSLKAKVASGSEAGEKIISFEAYDVVEDDAPNFPSKKVTVSLLLKDGRLSEQKAL